MDQFVRRSKPTNPVNGSTKPESRLERSEEPRTKRPRLEEVQDSDNEDEDTSHESASGDGGLRSTHADSEADDDARPMPQPQTAFDSSLPAVSTDQEAIEEYEVMRASQASQRDERGASVRLDKRHWVRGKSSIYVDAFNLALDTVLEDETHLFDDREMSVFEQWRALSYEAQYLSVSGPGHAEAG